MNKILNSARSIDIRLLLIIALITVSTGHVGRLFADREHSKQAVIGYLLAFAIDGVLAVSLADIARFNERSHKRFSLAVFVVTCTVSAGFNTAYYRQNYPLDHPLLSFGLGSVAPVLAALVAVMREFDQAERGDMDQVERKDERSFALDKFRIEQETNAQVVIEKERTKRERLRAKTAQSSAAQPVSGNGHKRSFTDFERAVMSGELSLDLSGSEIATWGNVSGATGRRWKRDIAKGE